MSFSSEPPKKGPTPKPPSRFRVLAPHVAKARAPGSSSLNSSAPGANGESQQQPHPQSPPEPPKSRPSLFSRLRSRYAALPLPFRRTCRVLRVLAPIVPIGLFFSEHVLQVMWVRGPSMTPYLNEDYDQFHTKSDVVLVNMWPFGSTGWLFQRKRRLERGMVVTFRSPANPSHVAIKRVIGLPGDRITTRAPCLKESQVVPFNHVWLEGDAADPKRSLDSNTYGPVSVSLITGRVLAVVYPKMRMLNWADWENGVVEGGDEHRFGDNYRQGVRDRVTKGAAMPERPSIE